jgi:hypothetical protein
MNTEVEFKGIKITKPTSTALIDAAKELRRRLERI